MDKTNEVAVSVMDDSELDFLLMEKPEYPKIEQMAASIFRIRPSDWNNVPRIVYDAVAVIVNSFDRMQYDVAQKFSEIGNAILALRNTNDEMQVGMNDNMTWTKEEMVKAAN